MSAPVRCDACGIRLLDDSSFCHDCGSPVAGAAPASQGEYKPITVLFIDAFGSIGLDDRLDAEQWHDVVESFFSVVSTSVQNFGGSIDRLTSEGIKVLFGAPVALENHATQACHAALHIRESLAGFAESFHRRAGVDFAVRMGLASGEALFGRLGAGGTGSFTSQGHVAALAARMQQLAEPGCIYLTEGTAALVDDYFELAEVGEFVLRNASRPVRTFELVTTRARRTRLDAARDRGLGPFLGRDAELATLERHLESVGPRETRFVGIVGEPGIGKSRLVEEFLARQDERVLSIQVTRCAEHARWVPFHSTIPYLSHLLGTSGHEDPVTTRDRITRAVLAVDPALADALPIVFTVLGLADSGESATATASTAPIREIARVIRRFMEHDADPRRRVVVVDDAQWMDAGSERTFADLVADPPSVACLVLVTYRRGPRRPWMRDERFSEVDLCPLDEQVMGTLVRALVGDERSTGDLAGRIRERAAGNPYFAEELVRALADTGGLVGQPGNYRLARADVEVPLPGSLQAALASRVDQLDDRAKAVLQAAAVIGREFPIELLAQLVELPPEELAPMVRALEAADLVHGFAWGERTMYAFRHPLLRETVYRSLLGEQRRRVHASIVHHLSAGASSGLLAAQIAPHAEAAGDSAAAAH
ncbi:MAG: hypothetical protein FJ148_23625, partial [Deltaproteobacteria bacterium]|nr:hypothetical protein [Deltaproteobacteria bacterium]